jgi:hypothetical protein
LGYALKYGVIKAITNFSVDQLLKVIKPINAVAVEAGLTEIPQPTGAALQNPEEAFVTSVINE